MWHRPSGKYKPKIAECAVGSLGPVGQSMLNRASTSPRLDERAPTLVVAIRQPNSRFPRDISRRSSAGHQLHEPFWDDSIVDFMHRRSTAPFDGPNNLSSTIHDFKPKRFSRAVNRQEMRHCFPVAVKEEKHHCWAKEPNRHARQGDADSDRGLSSCPHNAALTRARPAASGLRQQAA
jgi:hypothetical protein